MPSVTAGEQVFEAAMRQAKRFARQNRGRTYYEACFLPQTTGAESIIPDSDAMPWEPSAPTD